MGIEIVSLDKSERDTWDDYVSRSELGTFFHRYDVLKTIERHSNGELYTLVGYKGQEPVGIFPAYKIRKGGISTVFSPPPRLGLMFMGPATLANPQLKQRKRERQRQNFVEGCLTWFEEHVSPSYFRFSMPVAYTDVRPFEWNGYETTPRYTYRLDLTREIDVIEQSFSKSLRRYLDPDDDDHFQIEEAGSDGIRFIHEHVKARYQEQGKSYSVPLDYLLELYDTLPDGGVRPYVATVDGERASGILVLEGESTIYFSEGGGKPDVEMPINDLLHWQIIQSAKNRGIETYDMYGANTARICEYKSKFNPELQVYYSAKKGSMLMESAAKLYERFI